MADTLILHWAAPKSRVCRGVLSVGESRVNVWTRVPDVELIYSGRRHVGELRLGDDGNYFGWVQVRGKRFELHGAPTESGELHLSVTQS